jgi:hypothetical protein
LKKEVTIMLPPALPESNFFEIRTSNDAERSTVVRSPMSSCGKAIAFDILLSIIEGKM